ncbi:MAG: hypothetical protein OHK0044_00230 [Burkholderiaceae bacterium]
MGDARDVRWAREFSPEAFPIMVNDSIPRRTVDVFELARTRGGVAGELPIRAAERLAPMLAGTEGVVRYRAEFALDECGRPALRLVWSARVATRCHRCAAPVDVDIGADARFFFVRTEEELDALPIDPEEVEEPLLGSRSFDLAALVEDEAILGLPLAPRHARCGDDPTPHDGAADDPVRAGPFAQLARPRPGKR